ncbi:putative LRR receptor-like serine/threonine-protein kinase At1g51860 [Tasmannia lanceolata]|uniref:putative LRR receptor-like serine/threonine-protein kinase At1g51860 n=1 Tax=Tasmannia lanceolata TaxID=3420 RepID=UPI0040628DE5
MCLHVSLEIVFLATIGEQEVSIDCGSDKEYTDNGITWKTDGDFIKTGQNKEVSGISLSEQMNSLRFFTNQNKNCYTLPTPKSSYDSSSKVLIQAGFYYGNYDGLSKPPTFDLHLNGNQWATVVTILGGEPILHEVIFLSKSDNINVCLFRTNDGEFPFISSLQAWALGQDMYKDMNTYYSMFKSYRLYFGSQGMSSISYPDDSYNRLWTPSIIDNLWVWSANFSYLSENANNDPPFNAIRNEVEAPDHATQLVILPPLDFPQTNRTNYIALYFTEVFDLGSNDHRWFNIQIDGRDYGGTVSTEYDICIVVSQNSTLPAVGPMNITLNSAKGTTLAPAISAVEVYTYSEIIVPGTNDDDALYNCFGARRGLLLIQTVQGLANIASSFVQLNGWTGEPCLPQGTTWPWINCNGDEPPRVITLNLSGYGLEGDLPDFSQMNALQIM